MQVNSIVACNFFSEQYRDLNKYQQTLILFYHINISSIKCKVDWHTIHGGGGGVVVTILLAVTRCHGFSNSQLPAVYRHL